MNSENIKRLRTLQIGNDWLGDRQGGLNRFFAELLRHLPLADVDVQGVVAGSSRTTQESGGRIEAFASTEAPLIYRLYRARHTVLPILLEQRPDLIAVHFALYALPICEQLKGFPTVVHFHGPWAGEAGVEGRPRTTSRIQALIERFVYARGRCFIVLSDAFGKELVARYDVPEERVHVIPGGVDLSRFNDQLSRVEARERLGWPSDRPIVLAVRRQVRRMGLENLIDATRHVRQVVPEVLVLLAGSGPLQLELQQRIDGSGLQNNVRLLGRVEEVDLPVIYRAADISVVPTQALEGFGMITLESLASGTPVLVTPVGGLPEVLLPFAPQCILEGTTTEILGLALAEFLKGVRRTPSSEACREYAASQFSWPMIAGRVRDVYRQALD